MAALLSFLWPGLGQLYAGRRLAAAIFAAPVFLVLLALVYLLRRGVLVFGAEFINPSVSMGALVVVLLLGFWRTAAVVHAFVSGDPRRARRTADRVVMAALAVCIIFSHTAAGYVLWVTNGATSSMFGTNDSLIVQATAEPGASAGATPAPLPTATPTPPGIDSRVTILFTGVDAAPSRSEHLYDSIMVVSYDPKTNAVQMISVPRDSSSYPLYFGGQVNASVRINSLPTYVKNGWVKSPDEPYATLVKEMSYLVGIPVNYYAVMELAGFVTMIDMVGGIEVNNPSDIYDSAYEWPLGTFGIFQLSAGPHHLDGAQALAYVRSRHGANNNDWARSSRQQEVLVALIRKMAQPSSLLTLPQLISTLGSSISTTFPSDRIADYVEVASKVPAGNFKQVVLGPPYSILTNSANMGSSCLLNYKVAQVSIDFFGQDSLWYGKPLPANTCPAN